MTTLLPAILPVALIILIGFVVGRTLSLQRSTLSQIVLYVLAPALVIDGLYRTQLSLTTSSKLLIGFALTSGTIYGLVWLVSLSFQLDPALRRAITAIVMFPNNGNMGLPVATFAFGAAGLERAIVYMLGSSFVMFCLGPAIIKGSGMVSGLKLTLRLPLLYAIALGIGLKVLKLEFPWQLDQAVAQLGAAAIPIALILLGMQLSATNFRPKLQEIIVAIARLAIAPAIAYGFGRLLQLEALDLQVLVLQSAMPTAVNSFVIVSEFGGDKDLVARAIVTSTLMSFVSLPIILSLIIH